MGPRFPMHPMMYGQYPYPGMHPYMPYYPQGYMPPDNSRMQYDNYYTSLNPYAEPWNPNLPGNPPGMFRPPMPPYSNPQGGNGNNCPACSHKMQEEQRKREKESCEHYCVNHRPSQGQGSREDMTFKGEGQDTKAEPFSPNWQDQYKQQQQNQQQHQEGQHHHQQSQQQQHSQLRQSKTAQQPPHCVGNDASYSQNSKLNYEASSGKSDSNSYQHDENFAYKNHQSWSNNDDDGDVEKQLYNYSDNRVHGQKQNADTGDHYSQQDHQYHHHQKQQQHGQGQNQSREKNETDQKKNNAVSVATLVEI